MKKKILFFEPNMVIRTALLGQLIINKDFFEQPYEVIFRSISDSLKLIGKKYYPPRGKKLDAIVKKIEKKQLIIETLAGCIIKKVNGTVIISKE